jgi:putative addiction module killer protein
LFIFTFFNIRLPNIFGNLILGGISLVRAAAPKSVFIYRDANGREPFTEWLNGLRDSKGRRAILQRIGRIEQGLYGDYRPVGEGVSELRIFLGPGYRVYFGEEDGHIVIVLCGGGKGTQARDIKAARQYWKEYQAYGKA